MTYQRFLKPMYTELVVQAGLATKAGLCHYVSTMIPQHFAISKN